MRSPVLFLVFNRPETTRLVFAAIRAARPAKLYIAADGPRADRAGEAERCAEVRRIAAAVDWPCEVNALYRDKNLGCRTGVSEGITWFFSREEEGIILEDDVLPEETFFDFCDEMLDRYRGDDRVAMVTGCNFISNHFRAKESYFFSRYNHIWGWASWRRVRQNYDVRMTEWPTWRDGHGLAKISGGNRLFESFWRDTFDAVYEGKIDTWDYQWTFTCWRLGGLTAMPAFNQTHNLGFGPDATHTVTSAPEFVTASRVRRPMGFPLTHPRAVKRELDADASIDSKVFGITRMNSIKRYLINFSIFRRVTLSVRAFVKNAIQ
jgi:hypothetical protein